MNAVGELDDVSPELKAFLDYVAGEHPEDPFVEKLEGAVREARKNREWRHEYMTLLMRDQENIEKGIKQGREQGIQLMVDALRDFGHNDTEIKKTIVKKYSITEEEAGKYL